MNRAAYTILDRIADPLLSTLAMQEAASMPMKYPCMKVEKLYEFLMSMFPGKDALEAETNCTLWKPIFEYVVDKLDFRDHVGGIAHYSSKRQF